MTDATNNADLVRNDIKEIRNRSIVLAPNARCELCQLGILDKDFYAFGCNHHFHCDCLIEEMMNHHLSDPLKARFYAIDKRLKELQTIKNAGYGIA